MSPPAPSARHSLHRPPLVLGYRLRIALAAALIISVVGGGTLGYRLLEGWPLLDAFYMTVITMTTVGYAETRPLSEAGRLFTVALIVTSIGLAGYSISILVAFVAEGEFYRIIQDIRMEKRIQRLKNHIILCGVGRTGKYIADEFHHTGTSFVVVEHSSDVLHDALEMVGDFPYIQGDATDDDTLKLAGIDQARGLVAALGEDKDNVFLVLTARALNPGLRIIARVSEEENTGKLRKAGANEIVSPNAIGGLRMASVMLRPAVVSFLDEMMRVPDQTLRVEEVHVDRAHGLAGKTLREVDVRRRTGMLVLAVRTADGRHHFNPGPDRLLNNGDILIVIGTPEQIESLHRKDGLT